MISLAAALASFWFLEQPIRTRRWLRTPKLATTAAIGAYGGFGLVGASVFVPGPTSTASSSRGPRPTTTPDTLGAPPPRDRRDLGSGDDRARTGDDHPDDAAPLPPPRFGVFGDSTAVRTGAGLTEYGRRTGRSRWW